MNPYFWCFSAYATLIAPLALCFRLRLGRRSGYRVRLQAAGLPFARKRTSQKDEDERPIQEESVVEAIASANWPLIRAIVSGGVLPKLWAALHWESLSLCARFSSGDAAQTALGFSSLRTLLETLEAAHGLPAFFTWRAEADFKAEGTEWLLQGIAMARLGSLLPVAAALAAAWARERRRSLAVSFPGESKAAASASEGR